MKDDMEKVQQLIDGDRRPMRKTPTMVTQAAKAPLPESARWHMKHKPYQVNKK